MRRLHYALMAALVTFSISFVGVTSAEAKPAKPPATKVKYVALGDSFAAGTGLTPYSDSACYRSATQAYPTILAGRAYALDFRACSGATTTLVTNEQLPDQTATDVSVVTLTVGGNDIGFADILSDCVDSSFSDGCSDAQKGVTASKLETLTSSMETTITAVKTAYPSATVHVTGYPQMFGSRFTNGRCVVGSHWLLGSLWVSATDAAYLNDVAIALNGAISDAADAQGAIFDDVTGAFNDDPNDSTDVGHALCDSGTAWVSNVVVTSLSPLTVSERSFHPTATGQKSGYAASISLKATLAR